MFLVFIAVVQLVWFVLTIPLPPRTDTRIAQVMIADKQAWLTGIGIVATSLFTLFLIIVTHQMKVVTQKVADANEKVSAANEKLTGLAVEQRKKNKAEFRIKSMIYNGGFWFVDVANAGWKDSVLDQAFFERTDHQEPHYDGYLYDALGHLIPDTVMVRSGDRVILKLMFRLGGPHGQILPLGAVGKIHVVPLLGDAAVGDARFRVV